MADIVQAAKWMQEGKRVRRLGIDNWIISMKKNPRLPGFTLGAAGKDGRFVTATRIDANDLLADDWEIAD